MQSDTGEVSDDEEEQEDTIVVNGDYKLERQNSKQGSFKRQIVKVSTKQFFIIESSKTKTKVFTLANRNRCRQSNEPIRMRINYMLLAPSMGKRMRAEQVTIGFGVTSKWFKWHEIF